jgi:hypothetical protein
MSRKENGMKKGTTKSKQRTEEPQVAASPATFRELIDAALARLRAEATAAGVSLGFTADANLETAVREEVIWWEETTEWMFTGPTSDAEELTRSARPLALEGIATMLNAWACTDVGGAGEWIGLVDEYVALLCQAIPSADKRAPS